MPWKPPLFIWMSLLGENRPQEMKSGTGCQSLHESSQTLRPISPSANNHAPSLERAGTPGSALCLNRILLFLTFLPPEITSHPVSLSGFKSWRPACLFHSSTPYPIRHCVLPVLPLRLSTENPLMAPPLHCCYPPPYLWNRVAGSIVYRQKEQWK